MFNRLRAVWDTVATQTTACNMIACWLTSIIRSDKDDDRSIMLCLDKEAEQGNKASELGGKHAPPTTSYLSRTEYSDPTSWPGQ